MSFRNTVARLGAVLALSLCVAAVSAAPAPAPASDAADNVLSKESVLRDPEIPAFGNPNGDITVVEYFDYQCPYCKKVSPVLAQLMKDDGRVRVVFKDWPILGDPSGYAARLTLAAKFQNKYEVAHETLMARTGRLTEAGIDFALSEAGVDVTKAKADLEANKPAIDGILKRNNDQAEAFGFRGTPAFIIGTFRVPSALTLEQFKLAIADARAKAKKDKSKGK